MITSPMVPRPQPQPPPAHEYVSLWKHTPTSMAQCVYTPTGVTQTNFTTTLPSNGGQTSFESHLPCDIGLLALNGSHEPSQNNTKTSFHLSQELDSAGAYPPGSRYPHMSAAVTSKSLQNNQNMQVDTDTAQHMPKDLVATDTVNIYHHASEERGTPSSITRYVDDEDDIGVCNLAFAPSGDDLAAICSQASYTDHSKMKIKSYTQDYITDNGAHSVCVQKDSIKNGKNLLSASRPKSLTNSAEDMLILTQLEDSGKYIRETMQSDCEKTLPTKKGDGDSGRRFSLPSSPLHRLLSPKHRKSKSKKEGMAFII